MGNEQEQRGSVASGGFSAARGSLEPGYLMCIFSECALARDGRQARFRRGMERILTGTGHAAIPVNLQGLWGSVFSRVERPRWVPSLCGREVRVRFGASMGSDVSVADAQSAVAALAS